MNINEVIDLVGTPYQMFDEDKNYIGCFFPIYQLYPFLPRFPLPSADPENNFDYGLSKIIDNAEEICRKTLKAGDFIATKFNNELHIALYIGNEKILHVFRGHSLQVSRINILKDRFIKYFRVI